MGVNRTSSGGIKSTYQNGQNLRQKLDTKRFKTLLEIREVVTPEQRT